MKKWLIGAGVAVAAIGLVVGGAAFAASRSAGTAARGAAAYSQAPFMGGRMGAFQAGGMGVRGLGGQLHDYVFLAVAESLSLSVDELEAKLADGQDLSAIAQEQGLAEDELPALLEEARTSALAAAVEDGVLTKEQADWMSQHPGPLRMAAGARMRGAHWSRGPMGRYSFGQRWFEQRNDLNQGEGSSNG
jgi:hypothetical protein